MDNLKSIIKKVIDFYVFANLHVGFAVFALTKLTLLEIGISDNLAPLFTFFATVLSYNVIRFLRVKETKNWFSDWYDKNKQLLYLVTIISGVFLVYFLFKIRLKALFIITPFTLFTFLYVFPIKRFSLREKAGLKLFLISISWAGITVFFPLVQNYMQIRIEDILTFLQRFLFVFAITIPFDIRDLQYDKKDMQTLPQYFGVRISKQIAIFAMFLFFVISLFKSSHTIGLPINIVITILTILLIYFFEEKRNKYYTSFFIEGISILWFFLYLALGYS
jgi:hypothetical protein